jgi:hypothetical protein
MVVLHRFVNFLLLQVWMAWNQWNYHDNYRLTEWKTGERRSEDPYSSPACLSNLSVSSPISSGSQRSKIFGSSLPTGLTIPGVLASSDI